MLPLSLRSNVPAFLGRGEIDERSREADREWPIYDHHVICQRYNRIAAFIPFFEYAFFMPSGLRKRAVDQLKLRQGDRVLEVGCGTGRNFPFLRDPVGPEGAFMVSIYQKGCCAGRGNCAIAGNGLTWC
jgi:SAM-dependent methyltransferase